MALLATGCEKASFPTLTEGSYTGILKTDLVQPITAEAHPQEAKKPQRGWVYKVTLNEGSEPAPLTLRPLTKGHLALTLPGLLAAEVDLAPADDACFRPEAAENRGLQLCLYSDSLELDSTQGDRPFSLSLVASASVSLPPLEPPASFNLNEIISRARTQSFQSRIQVERALQSRLKARQAYLNLLPSLNLWGGIKIATAQDFLSIVNLAGSLTPFLFPGRWIQAAAATHSAKADVFGTSALRADVGFIAQTLSLSYLRDRETMAQLETELELIRPLRDELSAREKLGLLEPGASDELTLAVGQIELTREALRGSLVQSRATLAETLGFFNPDAVTEIEEDTTPEVEHDRASPDSSLESSWEQAQAVALTRSFELKQMDEAIRSAELEKIARFFVWLDPSGDSSGNIGFGLPNSVAVSQAKIAELKITRERLQAAVLQKLTESRNRLTTERSYQAILATQQQRQSERLERLMSRMKMGFQVPVADLLHAVQGRVQADLDRIRSRYQVKAADALWQRSLLMGPHAGN